MSAHPSHVSWPHRELHRRPQWQRSHARAPQANLQRAVSKSPDPFPRTCLLSRIILFDGTGDLYGPRPNTQRPAPFALIQTTHVSGESSCHGVRSDRLPRDDIELDEDYLLALSGS
eukprot:8010799-Pyramimonas_sp.AAC.1